MALLGLGHEGVGQEVVRHIGVDRTGGEDDRFTAGGYSKLNSALTC